MKYLVIAAHPDDEVLGCGGSMAKWIKAGNEVHVLIMAEGATSRGKHRDRESCSEKLSILAKSVKQAADILGVKSVKMLDYPDNRMDSVDLLDVVKSVEEIVEKLKPGLVVTHHAGDLNIDHQIIHHAVMSACRPQSGSSVKRILSFEVPSATEWNSHTASTPFIPNWFEDISKTLEQKVAVLEVYKSEMRKWPHSRSIKGVEHLAHLRGASVGCEAAEAFVLIRELR